MWTESKFEVKEISSFLFKMRQWQKMSSHYFFSQRHPIQRGAENTGCNYKNHDYFLSLCFHHNCLITGLDSKSFLRSSKSLVSAWKRSYQHQINFLSSSSLSGWKETSSGRDSEAAARAQQNFIFIWGEQVIFTCCSSILIKKPIETLSLSEANRLFLPVAVAF